MRESCGGDKDEHFFSLYLLVVDVSLSVEFTSRVLYNEGLSSRVLSIKKNILCSQRG